MKINKKICSKCEKEISASNYLRHFKSCKGKESKKNIQIKNLLQENGKYRCPYCDKEYTKNGIGTHIWRKHEDGIGFKSNNLGRIPWNKGMTKDTNEIVKLIGKKHSDKIKSGESIPSWKGKKLPDEIRENISKSMKKAHSENRAWNIGKSRWNNEPSYPEKFFTNVINNEFEDKNYSSEYPVSIYSIDFAWVDKKLAIEIDGAQHEKEEYKKRDERKDKCLKEHGWKVLRIKWSDMCNDPKKYIDIAKKFIENH